VDDWLILAALIFSLAVSSTPLIALRFDLGLRLVDANPANLPTNSKVSALSFVFLARCADAPLILDRLRYHLAVPHCGRAHQSLDTVQLSVTVPVVWQQEVLLHRHRIRHCVQRAVLDPVAARVSATRGCVGQVNQRGVSGLGYHRVRMPDLRNQAFSTTAVWNVVVNPLLQVLTHFLF